jgi:hypothetical protein
MGVVKRFSLACAGAAIVAAGAGQASAAVISVIVNAGDGEATPTSAGNQGKVGTLLSGAFNTTAISPVFPFQLPVLPAGEVVTDANLDVTAFRSGTTTFNADLYGLGFRATNAYTLADFFSGTLDATDATLIQDNQFTATTATGAARTGTSAAGDAALVAYLNAQYVGGATGGSSFAFLRYSPDFAVNPGTASSGSLGYPISSQETGAATQAVLTITTGVPEPGGVGLATAAVAGLLARRRNPPARSGRKPF